MFGFHKPSPAAIRAFLETQQRLDLSYAERGATAGTPPPGYVVDPTRVRLGNGEQTFLAACAALARWEHFRLGWVEAQPADLPLRAGETVAVVACTFGLWWLNACRIVYVVDEHAPLRRFGFAYGTLPGHVEAGEERFTVEWDRRDDSVWYAILAFSRPNHWLARLGYPIARRFQRRFARDSAAAMVRAAGELPRTATASRMI
jgi:uncharacterized protein (UPF0548 family)